MCIGAKEVHVMRCKNVPTGNRCTPLPIHGPPSLQLPRTQPAEPTSLLTLLTPAPWQMATRSGGGILLLNTTSQGLAEPGLPPCPFSLGWGSEKTLHHPLIQDSGHYRWAYGLQYSVKPGGNAMPKSMLIVFTDNC